VFRLVVVVIL